MEAKNFSSTITANISANEAIKKISMVPAWWGVGFSGSSEKQNDHFVIKMGPEAYFNCTVTELIPAKKVVWAVDECYMPWYNDKQEWTDTRMIFELSEHDGKTTLTFTHEGITPEVECYKDCAPGWTHWITRSLYSYFTTGKGDFDQSRK